MATKSADKICVTVCDGVNSLGGCHNKQNKYMTFNEVCILLGRRPTKTEKEYGIFAGSHRECDGWAGCTAGCNHQVYC